MVEPCRAVGHIVPARRWLDVYSSETAAIPLADGHCTLVGLPGKRAKWLPREWAQRVVVSVLALSRSEEPVGKQETCAHYLRAEPEEPSSRTVVLAGRRVRLVALHSVQSLLDECCTPANGIRWYRRTRSVALVCAQAQEVGPYEDPLFRIAWSTLVRRRLTCDLVRARTRQVCRLGGPQVLRMLVMAQVQAPRRSIDCHTDRP